MRLEVIPAMKGDCLLIHHETQQQPRLIIVDGGPGGVYTQSLKPRLEQLRQERISANVISDRDPLFIDLVVVSHVDDDHINGIIALFEDIAEGAPFQVGRLWHNSFDSLVAVARNGVAALTEAGTQVTASLSDAGIYFAADEHDDLEMVLSSIPQGHTLLSLARKLNVPVNPEFNGKAIEAAEGHTKLVDGLKVTFLGPMHDELADLRQKFAEWLAKKARGEASAEALLASLRDRSVANLSSIVILIEDESERWLLTGDARGDKMVKAADALNLLNADGALPLTIFKVPHHGSDRNNDLRTFQTFPATRYVFSGDGKHGNPERRTFEILAEARADVPITLELTYTPEAIDAERAKEWEKKRDGNRSLPPFDRALHGIEPVLQSVSSFTIDHP